MTGHLIVISGLPGVGKTSVAEVFAVNTGAVHLSIDPIEESILACGLPAGRQVGVAGYETVRAMAEQNLRLGHDVVVDAVNDGEEARQIRRTAAARTGAFLEFVHLMISDVPEHRRRLSGRDRGLAHVSEPTWSDVQRRRADYAVWSDEVLEFDTAAQAADEIADSLTERLSAR
ncbi:AAA family ATPase [Tomitella cavernea]|uniref:AAA family ATPase n=1 Tax=Tomitella cavernea TaxID=1387982 RepID=A0ABP9CIJ7_9ACTN|nr:AAA family ATPase [Tomitella cavernea]